MSLEHSRRERFTAYAHKLKERFQSGILTELQPLPQWVVLIDQKLEPVKNDLQDVKQGQAQIKTTVEAFEAGQKDIREHMATKADIQNLDAKLVKKIQDHEARIEELDTTPLTGEKIVTLAVTF